MTIDIQSVESQRQQKQFFKLPWELYADDPHWIPPLRTNQLELLGYKSNPFHQDADMQTFVALRDGQPCGRIAAIIHHAHNERYQERRGYFGFFESIDDEDVAGRLFDTAFKWLRERDMTAVRGPMNPSFNYEIGLLIEGFDRPPTFMMTYNPNYYPKLIESYGGFEKAQDFFAYWGHVSMLRDKDKKLDFIGAESMRRFNISVRPMDRRRFTQDIRTFLEIYNISFEAHWGFVPLSEAELKHMAASLKHLLVPQLTVIAEVDGKPIGCLFGMLDYNPRIKQIDGRLFPFGFARLLWNRRGIKKVRIIAVNVLPEYQRWGVGVVLINQLEPMAFDWPLEEAEFSWVMESNYLSRKTLERGGLIRQKTYRIYDRDLA
jgi:GNAT superfamily N-acetyltransferase